MVICHIWNSKILQRDLKNVHYLYMWVLESCIMDILAWHKTYIFHPVKACMGSRRIALFNLNFGNKYMWLIYFTSRPLFFWEKNICTFSARGLMDPIFGLDILKQRNPACFCPVWQETQLCLFQNRKHSSWTKYWAHTVRTKA